MQPVNGDPRGLVPTQNILDLLLNESSVELTYGCKWLGGDLTPLGDITEFMTDGSIVSRDNEATIQGSCSLMIAADAPINTLTDLVQPYVTLATPDGSKSATFNLGVFTLESPEYDNTYSPAVLEYTGYDLLYYLEQPIGDSFVAAAGTDPVSSVVTIIGLAFPGAIINAIDTTSVLAADLVWPLDASESATTYLDVANELLAAAGYDRLWVDWNGQFMVQPYIAPSIRPIEWTFDLTTSNNIVVEDRTVSQDLFDVPNYWQFIMSNLTGTPVEGISQYTYVDNSVNNIGSFANRGRLLNKQIVYVNATDYSSLFQQGTAQIVADTSPAETFTLSTFPLPLAWDQDMITYTDPNLAQTPPLHSPTRRLKALTWDLPLDGSADMSWTLQTVTQ